MSKKIIFDQFFIQNFISKYNCISMIKIIWFSFGFYLVFKKKIGTIDSLKISILRTLHKKQVFYVIRYILYGNKIYIKCRFRKIKDF